MINCKVSNTSNCLLLCLTVNLILGLREFNQSVKRTRSSWLPNQGLKQSSRNLDQSGGCLLLNEELLQSIVILIASSKHSVLRLRVVLLSKALLQADIPISLLILGYIEITSQETSKVPSGKGTKLTCD